MTQGVMATCFSVVLDIGCYSEQSLGSNLQEIQSNGSLFCFWVFLTWCRQTLVKQSTLLSKYLQTTNISNRLFGSTTKVLRLEEEPPFLPADPMIYFEKITLSIAIWQKSIKRNLNYRISRLSTKSFELSTPGFDWRWRTADRPCATGVSPTAIESQNMTAISINGLQSLRFAEPIGA